MIQNEVAKTLVDKIIYKPYSSIIDIGCGSGAVFKYLEDKKIISEKYIALDSSEEMLALHPSEAQVEKVCSNFDTSHAFSTLDNVYDSTLVLSSSALQWSQDIDSLFLNISTLAKEAYFAIFTDKTFFTLHQSAKLTSPIYSAKALEQSIQKYYDASFEIKTYKRYFDTSREMFSYIKKSGVSGANKRLSYKEAKALMHSYPLNYLEFEVLFVKAVSKHKKIMI